MKKFSAAEALQYAQIGELEGWIHEFLTTSGKNEDLSKGLLKKKRYFIGPKKIPLDGLQRICGPEPGMKYREPKKDGKEKSEELLVA